MARITRASRLSLRSEAERFLAEHGFRTPPLPPDQALAARKLEVTQLSLDDLLLKVNLPAEDHRKMQAMLQVRERAVTFRSGLPPQKRSWGSLHEVGHEFIPWQREVLYCCQLLQLPLHVQEQFEAEADIFAAEAFFFGDEFRRLASEGDWGLGTAKELAESVYATSFHSTFAHYAQESPTQCCLLVWKPDDHNQQSEAPDRLSLHYYVPSSSFRGRIDPGQIADPDGAVTRVFGDPALTGITKHEMTFTGKAGEKYVAQAESFSNSYNVFTLVSQPVRRASK